MEHKASLQSPFGMFCCLYHQDSLCNNYLRQRKQLKMLSTPGTPISPLVHSYFFFTLKFGSWTGFTHTKKNCTLFLHLKLSRVKEGSWCNGIKGSVSMFLSTVINTSSYTWWIIWPNLCYGYSSCLHHSHPLTLATNETSLIINTNICWRMWNIQHCTCYLPLCLCLFLVICEVTTSVLWSYVQHLIIRFLTMPLPSSEDC